MFGKFLSEVLSILDNSKTISNFDYSLAYRKTFCSSLTITGTSFTQLKVRGRKSRKYLRNFVSYFCLFSRSEKKILVIREKLYAFV